MNSHCWGNKGKVVSRIYETIGILGVNRRVIYLIDPEGTITGVYRSEARPKSHVEWARGQLASMTDPTLHLGEV